MRTHATTTYIGTYIRMFVLLLLSALFVYFVPFVGGDALDSFLTFNASNIGILYAITIGFLMMIAINRKQLLDSSISLEINKIRRMHHLALNLHKVTPGTDAWYKALDTAIKDYLKGFDKRDFLHYEEGNAAARKMTYAIYSLPQITSEYNSELYQFLIEAAGDITEARENIRATTDASIGYFQWFVTIVMTLLLAVIVVIDAPYALLTRVLTGVVVFNLFLMLQLIYEYDQTNPKKRRYYIELYLQNVKAMIKP